MASAFADLQELAAVPRAWVQMTTTQADGTGQVAACPRILRASAPLVVLVSLPSRLVHCTSWAVAMALAVPILEGLLRQTLADCQVVAVTTALQVLEGMEAELPLAAYSFRLLVVPTGEACLQGQDLFELRRRHWRRHVMKNIPPPDGPRGRE